MSTYYELLLTEEWKNKRMEILKRDNYQCTDCNRKLDKVELKFSRIYVIQIGKIIRDNLNKRIPLQVHHKYYIIGKAPWEYNNDDLVTVCAECHQKIHDTQKIYVYQQSKSGLIKVSFKLCDRCNGSGGFPEYEHVENGVCFKCNGRQFVTEVIV